MNRKSYLNDIFNDNPDLETDILFSLDTDDIHYLADIANWDIQLPLLQWIIEQDICSQATALMTFWRAQPQEFTCYRWDGNLDSKQDVFVLIKTIVNNYTKGFYKKTQIHYDPQTDMQEEEEIPQFMYYPAQGEVAYSIYDEREINSWFAHYFENKLFHCDSTMDLYGIACYVKDPDKARLILEHPLCDKGIALMLFWRLNTYANIFVDGCTLKSQIISQIKNNTYPEILAYDPKKDKFVKVIKPNSKWEIPPIMKEAI